MWQVQFYIVLEQEHARQLERERRRRLLEPTASPRRGPGGRLADAVVGGARAVVHEVVAAISRPAVGPHHL
jgi:hypothetical protein